MSFLALPNEIILLLASQLRTADINFLLQTDRRLAWLLTPLFYDRAASRSIPELVLPWASERGLEGPINQLIDRGVTISQTGYRYAGSPMLLAARFGHARVIEIFLQRLSEECLNAITTTSHGPPAYELAAEHGHLRVVELMLPHVVDRDLTTALEKAAGNGHTEIVTLLLPYSSTSQLHVPLNLAAAGGYKDIVTLLLPYVEAANLPLALDYASGNGHKDIVLLLLPQVPKAKLTPALINAAARGFSEIAALLLSEVDVDSRPAAATAALPRAVKEGYEAVVDVLVGAGGTADSEMRQYSGQTVLHWLAEFAPWLALTQGRAVDKIFAALLVSGCDAVAAVDVGGRTPLHLLARNGAAVVRRRVVSIHETSAEVGIRYAMASHVQGVIVRGLVKAGADINARDLLGRTPLHQAAENSDEEMVGELLDMMPDTGVVDRKGRTALDLATGFMDRAGATGVVCAIRDYELAIARSVEQLYTVE